MIYYTIIIPHRNSADLLQYCLDSIPVRDDVQVIVVDDNSDADRVDFNNFPQWKGDNYEFYLTHEGKGAGYARNVALEHAEGKWLLFLDSDDYVKPNIEDFFDKYKNSEADLIYFRPSAVMLSDRCTPSRRASAYNQIIDEYFLSKNEHDLRCHFFSPTCKFIRRSVVVENRIKFDEIRYSNDNFFSVAIGCLVRTIEVEDDGYYVITESGNSLTSNFCKKPGELRCRAFAFLHASRFAWEHGIVIWEPLAVDFMRRVYGVENDVFYGYYKYFRSIGYSHKGVIWRFFEIYDGNHRYLHIVKFVITIIYLSLIKERSRSCCAIL